jgi:hypothetical protein
VCHWRQGGCPSRAAAARGQGAGGVLALGAEDADVEIVVPVHPLAGSCVIAARGARDAQAAGGDAVVSRAYLGIPTQVAP